MSASYSGIARGLHWLVAGLIVAQYIIAELAELAESSDSVVQQLGLLANHKSIGMTILGLAVLRLIWRLFNKPPALPASMSAWQRRASSFAHVALYGFLFVLPLSGWLMSSATSYSVSWFNLFVFPDLIAANEANAETLEQIHYWSGEALFVLALIHIVAALKHHYLDKDVVLKRMASRGGWLLMLTTLVLAIGLFGRVSVSQKASQNSTSISSAAGKDVSANQNAVTNQSLRQSNLPIWNIDYQDSYIEFSGDQAGAPFKGRWQTWQAQMQFDTQQLAAGRFAVTIEPASVFTDDKERDGYIRDPDFFDVENHRLASFNVDKFSQTESNSFIAHGLLTMKNISHPLDLVFTVKKEQSTTVLEGQAAIDRLQWNIGMGDWTDTSWVGQEILVKVRVVAN